MLEHSALVYSNAHVEFSSVVMALPITVTTRLVATYKAVSQEVELVP